MIAGMMTNNFRVDWGADYIIDVIAKQELTKTPPNYKLAHQGVVSAGIMYIVILRWIDYGSLKKNE